MPQLNIARSRDLLQRFDFKSLFIDELGGDHRKARGYAGVGGVTYPLEAIAEKRGMVAYLCSAPPDGYIPEYRIRRKIEQFVTRTAREHLIIYVDAGQTIQIWQWVKRET